MLKVYGRRVEIKPEEWKQTCEVIHGGVVIGFVDREVTPSAEITKTRNMNGEVVDGECLDWLLYGTRDLNNGR